MPDIDPFDLTFLILLIIILTTGLFFLMMQKLFRKSSFHILYERWPAPETLYGRRITHQHIGLNDIWYKNCATFTIADEGLGIAFSFPVSLIHKQGVLVPWKKIRFLQKDRVFWTNMYRYEIDNETPVQLLVMKKIVQAFPASHVPAE
jgi:hypothetical protein